MNGIRRSRSIHPRLYNRGLLRRRVKLLLMKYFRIIFGIATLLLTIIVVFSRISNDMESPRKLQIVTTIFPLYDFARSIGGDKVNISLFIPPGIEVHHFEPKPSDISKINSAKIFVYTGAFMEPWVNDIVGSSNSNIKVVDSSIGVELVKEKQGDQADPHIWLDFENAKIMAGNIAKTLSEVDPHNARYYQNNLHAYQSKLSEIDSKYKDLLSTCQSKTIVYGGHYAFGYMARRYNLTYTAAQGFSPDSEPTAQDLIRLTKEIKDHNIHYVFYEELTSPKTAETLARETGAKLLLLNAAHNISKIDSANTISFVSIMEQNLENLQVGLRCKK